MAKMSDLLLSKSASEKVQALAKWKKCAVINAFWPHMHVSPLNFIEEDYEGFFRYMGKTLQDLYTHEADFAAQSFDSLFMLIATMRDTRSLAQKDMFAEAQKSYLNTSDAAISQSIQLAIRLWLCLHVSSPGAPVIGARNPRDSRVNWTMDESLDQMAVAHFPGDSSGESTKCQLDDSLTLANLRRICRLHIRWTSNLKDHLRLEGPKGRRSLSVFQHRIFLVNHYNEPDPIIPKDVLAEAIRTLDLLLPFGDPATERLLEQSKMSTCVPLEMSRTYDLGDFKHWKNNLVQLLDVLNGPPETLFQTLRDTRNLSQWATLWIAVFGIFLLTLVFGILTTIYSIRQYRVTVDSYEISVKSYDLAVAVACQQRTAPLSGLCD